jgi:hypothetical protein
VSLSTIKQLAIAVLSDDRDAAQALFDLCCNEYSEGGVQISPVKKITVPFGRLRVIGFVNESLLVNQAELHSLSNDLTRWIRGEDGGLSVACVKGIGRVEIYEMPEGCVDVKNVSIHRGLKAREEWMGRPLTPDEVRTVEEAFRQTPAISDDDV